MAGTTQLAELGRAPTSPAGTRRMMVFRAFMAQNVAIGCAFGGFGVSVIPLQEHYGASRGTATLALALCVMVQGLVGPLIGSLIGRIGLRWTMTIGALISGAGYALLAVAPSMPVVLLLYALPIGVGLAMFGSFPASVLASNWFPRNPGTALGIANTPLLVAILPMAGLVLIRDYGLASFSLALAALLLIGAGAAGVYPAINMLSGRLFGIGSLPRVIGLSGMVTLPLTFCLPPLAGVLRDAADGYAPVIAVIVASATAAAIIFMVLARLSARQAPALAT